MSTKNDIEGYHLVQSYSIVPVPKPRMTRRDSFKGKKRPAVARFYAFRDQIRYQTKGKIPTRGLWVIAWMPIPKSRRGEIIAGTLHEQTPDADNVLKALGDSWFHDDSVISDVRITKIWGNQGMIEVWVCPKIAHPAGIQLFVPNEAVRVPRTDS